MTKTKAPTSRKPARPSTGKGPQAAKSARLVAKVAGKRKPSPMPPATPPAFDASRPLANARHELVAQNVAKGMGSTAAYAAAGFKPNRANAHKTITKHDVSSRIQWLLTRAAEQTEVTLVNVLRELASIGFDRSGGTRKADRVAALHLLGKHVGAFPTRIALGGDPDAPAIKTETTVKAEIEAKVTLDEASLALLIADLRKGL